MAQHGKSTAVLVDQYDLSAYFNNVDWSRSCDTADTTTFGATSKSYIAGFHDGTMSLSGLFDGTTGAVDQRLHSALGAGGTIISALLQGQVVGGRAKLCQAIATSKDVSNAVGDVVAIAAEVQGDGGVWGGDVLIGGAPVTVTGNSANVDSGLTSGTTDGWVANLHVTTVTGTTPSGTFKVSDSADGTTFADLAGAAFTAVTAAGAQQISGTGTVRRWVRGSYTVTGTTPNFAVVMTFARK